MRSDREPGEGRASAAKSHGEDRGLCDDRKRAALRRRAPDPVRRSRREQLWDRLAEGDLRNVGFVEFRRLIESFGFRLRRVSGSHHIYTHPQVPRPLSLQPRNREAKPYQISQFLDMVREFGLTIEHRR
jgi:hypothetical protein